MLTTARKSGVRRNAAVWIRHVFIVVKKRAMDRRKKSVGPESEMEITTESGMINSVTCETIQTIHSEHESSFGIFFP